MGQPASSAWNPRFGFEVGGRAQLSGACGALCSQLGERNVILNPLHERLSEVRLVSIEPLAYDERIRRLLQDAHSGT